MKRNLTLLLILALVLSLALPSAALAKRGGVPANGKSAGKAAPVDAADEGESDEEAAEADDPARENDEDEAEGKDDGTDEGDCTDADDCTGADDCTDADDCTGVDEDASDEPEDSDESSPTVEAKRTGIENALSRLQRNLARMQAQLEAGERTRLPEGLQNAIAKFMSWLGIDPAVDEAENTDEGSDGTSGTVEPEPADVAGDEAAGADTTTGAPAGE